MRIWRSGQTDIFDADERQVPIWLTERLYYSKARGEQRDEASRIRFKQLKNYILNYCFGEACSDSAFFFIGNGAAFEDPVLPAGQFSENSLKIIFSMARATAETFNSVSAFSFTPKKQTLLWRGERYVKKDTSHYILPERRSFYGQKCKVGKRFSGQVD